MKISLVRKIDYWAGIPICFVFDLIYFLNKLNPFKRKISGYQKNFLFIELSEMGSSILTYPAMKYLKNKYPDAELFFMIFEKNRASVDILNTVKPKNVLTIREDSFAHFLIDALKCCARMRKEKIDVVFDLELFSRATAILTYLSGAKVRVGFYKYQMEGLYRGNFFTHKIQYNFRQHISRSFLSFVKSLELNPADLPTMQSEIKDEEIFPATYSSSEKKVNNIWNKLQQENQQINKDKKIFIFNPSGGEIPIRAWPLNNYINLAQRLLANENIYLIATGGKSDLKICEKFCKAINNNRCLNLTGKTTFTELIDLYNISDVLITNDSGPAHFASLTPIQIFVFFGPENSKLYCPLGKNINILYSNFPCSPCLSAFNHRFTSCKNNRCLQAISVDEVYNKIINKL